MTAVEIINETANFYNIGNRAFDNGGCSYKTSDGNMCAVGRCLTDAALQNIQDMNLNQGAASDILEIDKDKYKSIFKPEYVLDMSYSNTCNFWEDLQSLHDRADNWTVNGLSEEGRKKCKDLIREYA